MLFRCLLLLAIPLLSLDRSGQVWAAGGAEAVCLLVNRDDADSVLVAERYAVLRGIPRLNVVELEGVPAGDRISLSELKELILQPAFARLQERGIAGKIDYLVYSTGFPTRVGFSDRGKQYQWVANAEGSITGMSYLYRLLDEERLSFLAPDANRYFGGRVRLQTVANEQVKVEPVAAADFFEPVHFRSRYYWGTNGMPVAADAGIPYLICSMLGVVGETGGNTVDEILASLSRSVAADGSGSDGTFYFMRNGDVRSKTREWAMEDAAGRLRASGQRVEILAGALPRGRKDIAGLMMGAAAFDWAGSGNELLPGALCENLTSFGARFVGEHGQTRISAFVRAGAAGATGAVSEPYGLQFKFPTPYLFVNYASGLSMGEAYYRSISSPYNLLLLGDPLCRPYSSGSPR